MAAITIEVSEKILESHQHNLDHVKADIQQGFVIWEYLTGHLSLRECGEILRLGYRGFLELLWSKGIPIDGLSEVELNNQFASLRKVLATQ
jgi:hypothetical protein